MVTQAVPMVDVGDFCPVVPAACVAKAGGEVVDAANPFSSFWDSFFVSSPAEALETPLRMIYAVPRPDFDAAWFRDAYTNTMAFYGVGIAILIIIVSIGLNATPQGSFEGLVNSFVDFFITLFQIAFMPVFSGIVLLLSAEGMKAVLAWVNAEDPQAVMSYFATDYFAVGWMSLFARIIGLFLTIEVVVLYLIQIFATLISPLTIPARGLNNYGRMWYVRTIRGILLGFAPLLMGGTLASFVFLLQRIPAVGSERLFQFVGAGVGMIMAGIVPLWIARKSRDRVASVAMKLSEPRYNPTETLREMSYDPASSASFNSYMARRESEGSELKNLVKDVALVGAAIYTGGAAAGAMAGSATRSKTANKAMRAFGQTMSVKSALDTRRQRKMGDE